jgi:transposase InsO family protein
VTSRTSRDPSPGADESALSSADGIFGRHRVADLTRIMTGEGVLWLASVRDAFSNKVVGWATAARADTELVLAALDHALRSRNIHDGQLVHHSDKGCQTKLNRSSQHQRVEERVAVLSSLRLVSSSRVSCVAGC